MSNLNLTGQEQYILKLALDNFKTEVEKSEFQPNSIITKEFIISHIDSLNSKIEKLQEQLEGLNL